MKPQWKEVTNELVQVPVNQQDFVGCIILYDRTPLFRIGWTPMQLALQTGQQILQVSSAVIGSAPPFRFSITNAGFRCWMKLGVATPPTNTIILPT